MTPTPNEAGAELLEVVPQLMRAIRDQMRQHHAVDLSVPEFRTLGLLTSTLVLRSPRPRTTSGLSYRPCPS